MKVGKNFDLREFVHPNIYAAVGNRSIDWLNPELIDVAQQLRDDIDCPIVINTWYSTRLVDLYGNYTDSGLRDPFGTVGVAYSAHRGGCAMDIKPLTMETDEVFDHLLKTQYMYPYISRIEHADVTVSKYGQLGRDWLHIEVCSRPRPGVIQVFGL